jgi:L-ribulose-5-phosphate 3-epimerase
MSNPMPPAAARLAVCSWSLQPAGAGDLFERLESTGVKRLQLALDPLRENPDAWDGFAAACAARGVGLASGMFGTVGEDYTTLESIRRTGGVVPDATWPRNLENIREAAALAAGLGLGLVTFHAGFLPHDPADPDYAKLKGRIAEVAGIFAARGIALALETGQETAATLRDFLDDLASPNVGVNFDPANMILYGKGDPLEALRTLGPWLRQVHIKDAQPAATPGEWGAEVVAGTGAVPWPAFFAALAELGFTGNLCIEREAGASRIDDIRTARELVLAMP